MTNFTTNTYEMKRIIVNYSEKISKGLNKPKQKFIKDIQYGLVASGSCLISEISRTRGSSKKGFKIYV